jgi:hypothetical protein
MGWMIEKIMKPRRSLGLKIFANPMIQLGDIVGINYKNKKALTKLQKKVKGLLCIHRL